MDHERVPMLPPPTGGLRDRVLRACASGALATSLLVSPRPAVAVVRRVFAAGGAATAERLLRHAPADVATVADVRYGSLDDETFDLYRPTGDECALPLLVWVHGGGWVAGSKEELAGYMRLIASRGYAVVAPAYSLAPDAAYPGPLRQIAAVLAHVRAHAGDLGVDASRVVVAGDSAGAQLAAQVAALVTTPGYDEAVGVTMPIGADALRGVVLACGPFAPSRLGGGDGPIMRRFTHAVLWAYSGRRRHRRSALFATADVLEHLSPAFPPALITVGNGDPLRGQSHELARRLEELGLTPRTMFFPEDHTPALPHEYQFDLDGADARTFLSRLNAFLADHLGTPTAD